MSYRKPKITCEMLNKLQYDSVVKVDIPSEVPQKAVWNKPALMIVFDKSDVNSAAYYAAKSAQNPFAPNSIASVFVQESIRDMFISKVVAQLKQLDSHISGSHVFKKTKELVKRMNATVVVAKEETAAEAVSPTIVCDFTQGYFGSGPNGILTLHTFRTAKEVISLYPRELVSYDSASIWIENLSCAYELAAAIMPEKCFFNCFNVPLDPVCSQPIPGHNYVNIVGGYHYEVLILDLQTKIIIFPIGTIFAN